MPVGSINPKSVQLLTDKISALRKYYLECGYHKPQAQCLLLGILTGSNCHLEMIESMGVKQIVKILIKNRLNVVGITLQDIADEAIISLDCLLAGDRKDSTAESESQPQPQHQPEANQQRKEVKEKMRKRKPSGKGVKGEKTSLERHSTKPAVSFTQFMEDSSSTSLHTSKIHLLKLFLERQMLLDLCKVNEETIRWDMPNLSY